MTSQSIYWPAAKWPDIEAYPAGYSFPTDDLCQRNSYIFHLKLHYFCFNCMF